jgi:hypothetical protein
MTMKMTLLAMTQDVLSELTSDEVNSISDTTESMQVATIIRNKYNDIITRAGLTKHQQLFQLNASNDITQPVLMIVPNNVCDIQWIKYYDSNVTDSTDDSEDVHDLNLDITDSDPSSSDDTSPSYKYVTLLPLQQFLDMTNRFNTNESDVKTFTFGDTSNSLNYNFTFNYKNDRQPHYAAIISNNYVVFDSFDNTQDTTLQASKVMGFGAVLPDFTMTDSFVPDMDEEQFPLLLNEAKSWAYFVLKQTAHPKAEQESKRQWGTIQRNKSIDNKPNYFDQLANFGRH